MKFLASFIFFLFSFYFLNSQTATISEITKPMSLGEQKGLEIIIPNTTVNAVDDKFSEIIKSYRGKYIKPAKGSLEYISYGSKITTYGTYMTDVYAYIYQENNNVRLTMFLYNEGAFVSASNSGKFKIASNIAKDIFNKIIFEQIQIKVDIEDKILKSLLKDQKDLYQEEDNCNDKIRKCDESISNSEIEIKENESKKLNNESTLRLVKEKLSIKENELKPLNKPLIEAEIKALDKDIDELDNLNKKLKSALKDKQKSANGHNELLVSFEKQVDDNNQKLVEKNRRLTEKRLFLKEVIMLKEDELKDLQHERESLTKSVKNNIEKINDYRKNIEVQKGEIVLQQSKLQTNKATFISKKAEIEKQRNNFDLIKKSQDLYK